MTRLLSKQFLITLCFFILNESEAQVYFSTNSGYLRHKTEGENLLGTYKYAYPDTSIDNLHNYFPRNFSGNTGLPSPAYILGYNTPDLGFRLYPLPYENDFFSTGQVRYYRSAGPFADLTGIAGSKELQIFKLFFTHTYRDKINLSLRLNRHTSTGFYARQQTYTNNFYLSSNYTSVNKRTGYYLYLINNGNKNNENGGIAAGDLDERTLFLNKDILNVNLLSANRDNRETRFMLNPWLRINKESSEAFDHYLQLKSAMSRSIYQYRDNRVREDDFYKLVYLDEERTNDSTSVRQLGNELSYALRAQNGRLDISAGYKNEMNLVWQKNDSLFFNHILKGGMQYQLPVLRGDSLRGPSRLMNELGLQYVVKGANEGDYKADNTLTYQLDETRNKSVFISLLAESRHPDYIYNYWVSNHFLWLNNAYLPQRQLKVRAGFRSGKLFSGTLFYQRIDDLLYFDQLALPRQYNGRISNAGITLSFSKIFLKHLGVALDHVFQASTHTAYIRMPRNVSTSRLFFNGNLFKNKMQLQMGAQLQLYEAFYSYGYMPSTQAYYLQESFSTETYPFVDVYLNVRIRPVSVFLKIENLLQGYAGYNYAFIPGYYQPDRAFRFGINWMFFD